MKWPRIIVMAIAVVELGIGSWFLYFAVLELYLGSDWLVFWHVYLLLGMSFLLAGIAAAFFAWIKFRTKRAFGFLAAPAILFCLLIVLNRWL